MTVLAHRRHRRRPVLVALLALLALLTAACGSSGGGSASPSSSSSGASSKPAAQQTIRIGIDVSFHPIWDYLSAQWEDYFKDTPYKLEWKVLDASTQVPAFGKGDLDIMTTPPSFMPRVKEQYGLDVTYFFPLARWTIGPQILVPADSPITSLEQLKGKKVAIPPLASRFGAEEAAIQAATGTNIRDYFALQETDAAPQQLSLGNVDAAFIEAPSTYPLLESKKFKPVYSVHDAFQAAFGDPGVMNGGYIARTEFVKNNQDFIKTFVAANQDVWSKYQADPKSVNTVASKVSGVPVEQLQVVGEVLDLVNIGPDERRVNAEDVATWKKMFDLLKESGFNKTVPADAAALFQVTT